MANNGSGTVSPVAAATNLAGSAITVGKDPVLVAVRPDGKTAYVTNLGSGTVSPIDTSTNVAGSAITVGSLPIGVAITPDSKTAYVTSEDVKKESAQVFPIDTATNNVGTGIPVGRLPTGIVITPDQAPTASFTTTPAPAGSATAFDGSASSAPVGTISTYAWNFGDGAVATTTTPTTTHPYAKAGTYTVRLTVTDSAGTSTTQVFTGQTVSNNGGPSATTTRAVTIGDPLAPVAPITATSVPVTG